MVISTFQTQHGERVEGGRVGGPAISKEGSQNPPEPTTGHFVYILLAELGHMIAPARVSGKCSLYSEQSCSQLWKEVRKILRNMSSLCHKICLAFYCSRIIFISIIWSDTHMLDRISSLFQRTQLESGRVRGTEGCFDADALSCFPG